MPLIPAIELSNLTKSYGKARGVEDISFTVNKGQVLGFLGPNGAGKTTAMRAMLGLIKATSGSSLILGKNSLVHDSDLLSRIGYLPGALALYKNQSGYQYLHYISKLRKVNCENAIRNLAERLKLDLSKDIHALSKGNRQKVSVIQAFMHNPEVLILDEPTSGLDPLIQCEFKEILQEAKERGVAILLSSHVLSEVENLADRIAIISEGRIVLNEDIATLKSRVEHTITFSFSSMPDISKYRSISKSVSFNEDSITCSVSGAEQALLKQAATDGAIRVRTNEPSLDEIFLNLLDRQVRS